jgi:hypothetical protein
VFYLYMYSEHPKTRPLNTGTIWLPEEFTSGYWTAIKRTTIQCQMTVQSKLPAILYFNFKNSDIQMFTVLPFNFKTVLKSCTWLDSRAIRKPNLSFWNPSGFWMSSVQITTVYQILRSVLPLKVSMKIQRSVLPVKLSYQNPKVNFTWDWSHQQKFSDLRYF